MKTAYGMRIRDWTSDVCSSDLRVYRVYFQRRRRLLLLAAGDPFDRIVGADQARQAHGATETRKQAELGFRQADLRGRAHHAIVGRQRHLEAATERDAVDRGDARERQRSEEHTSELQTLTRITNAVFLLKKKNSTALYRLYKKQKKPTQHI